MNHVRQVMTLLHDFDVTLKLKEFGLLPTALIIVEISLAHGASNELKCLIAVIRRLQNPKTITELQFFGVCVNVSCTSYQPAHVAVALKKKLRKCLT